MCHGCSDTQPATQRILSSPSTSSSGVGADYAPGPVSSSPGKWSRTRPCEGVRPAAGTPRGPPPPLSLSVERVKCPLLLLPTHLRWKGRQCPAVQLEVRGPGSVALLMGEGANTGTSSLFSALWRTCLGPFIAVTMVTKNVLKYRLKEGFCDLKCKICSSSRDFQISSHSYVM